MAYTRIEHFGTPTNSAFICDLETDKDEIGARFGDTVIVIESNIKYIFSSEHEWMVFSTPDEDDTHIDDMNIINALNAHIANTNTHITSEERVRWEESRRIADIASRTAATAGERAELGIAHGLTALNTIQQLTSRITALEERLK